jgi:hypothetical protein
VAKGLTLVYDKTCYSGSSTVSILQENRNGKQLESRDR